jgi:hypothetical protein
MSASEFLTFESLWDDYERRSDLSDGFYKNLERANPRLYRWFGSIDYSGRTREKYLRELITWYEPGDENRILLRLGDWVPLIRALARDWVLVHFHTLPFEAIRANQKLLLYLSRKQDLREDVGLAAIQRNLLARACTLAEAEFFSLSANFRRFLYTLSMGEAQELRPLILRDPQASNRILLLSRLRFSELTEAEKHLLEREASVQIRRRYFMVMLEAGITPSRDQLLALVLHRGRGIREFGQFYLKKYYGEDAYAIYKGMQGEAFFYITDYARADDSVHFLEGMRCGSNTVQLLCLRALASVAPERIAELDIPALIGRNTKFRAILTPVLPELLTAEEIVALRPLYERISPNSILNFFWILEKKSYWAFVNEWLAVVLEDSDFKFRDLIFAVICQRTSVYDRLEPQLRDSISARVSQLRACASERFLHQADQIDFILKSNA